MLTTPELYNPQPTGIEHCSTRGRGYLLVYLHVSAVFSTLKPMVQKIRFSFKVSNIGSLQRTPFSDNTISEKNRVVLGVDDNPAVMSISWMHLSEVTAIPRGWAMLRTNISLAGEENIEPLLVTGHLNSSTEPNHPKLSLFNSTSI